MLCVPLQIEGGRRSDQAADMRKRPRSRQIRAAARTHLNRLGTVIHLQVETEADLTAALKHASGPASDKCVLLDVKLAPNDVSAELFKFGAELGKFGSRPPRPG